MPSSKRGHEIDLSYEGTYGKGGDTTIMTGEDFSEEVDLVIKQLSKQRQENSDNQVLDDILANSPNMVTPTYANIDPFEAEKISNMEQMGAITSDIVKGLLRNPDGMTVEDFDYFSKIQENNAKYNKEDMAMAEMNKNIEEQLKSEGYDSMEGFVEASIMADMGALEARISKAEAPQEIVEVEEVATKEEMFPGEAVDTEVITPTPEIDTVESIGEAVQINDDMEPVVQIEPKEDTPSLTDDELEDVPVSTLEVTDDQVLKNMHNIVGNEISDSTAMALVDIMTRYKNGEKFSVYDALPETIKMQIHKTASEDGTIPRHAILEFFAKNLINDIISDAFMSTEIQNFQEELNTFSRATGNVTGVIIDSYTDEVKEKFEDGLLKSADKIQESNPEKAEELREIAKYFSYTHTFELIKRHLENGGDTYLNRCYKKTRKINQYVMNFNAYYEGVTPKIRDIGALAIPFRQLLIDEEVAETMIIMLGDSCYEQKKGSLEGNVYAFYLLTGVMNIAMSADTSDTIREIRSNIASLVSEVRQFLNRRSKDSKYGNKKKKGKKRGH